MQLTLEIYIELKLNRFLLYFHYIHIHLFFKIRFNIKINYFLNDFYSLK